MKPLAYATIIAIVGVLLVCVERPRPRAARSDVAGTIELYGNGSIVIETATEGLREVQVNPRTHVLEDGMRVRALALRPGRLAAVWLDAGTTPPTAREIVVWGR